MKTKKFLKVITLAISFLTAGFSFGDTNNGDIYEIRPCDEYGKLVTRTAADEPITSGTLYFNMRLVSRQWNDCHWQKLTNSVDNPLQLGIFVNGKETYADYHTAFKNGDQFTDFIFKYKVKSGDIAMPVVLAVGDRGSARPANSLDEGATPKYVVLNANLIFNNNNDTFKPWLWNLNTKKEEVTDPYEEQKWIGLASPDGDRSSDVTGEGFNYKVQTVVFDEDVNDDGKTDEGWNVVKEKEYKHQIKIEVYKGDAEQDSTLDEDVELYVWSDNEEAVKVVSENEVELNVTVTEKKKTAVKVIRMLKGQSSATFNIEGIKDGGEANLILSRRNNYIYQDGTNFRIEDYIKVPVYCKGVKEPTVAVKVNSNSEIKLKTNGDYKNSKGEFVFELSQAYDKPLTIKLTSSFVNGAVADVNDYVFISTDPSVNSIPLLSDREMPTVTIPTGVTVQKFYIYTLRADANTSGNAAGIKFTPSIVDDAAAESIFTSLEDAVVQIVADSPTITPPALVEGYIDDPIDFNIIVSDTYADETEAKVGTYANIEEAKAKVLGYKIQVSYEAADKTFEDIDGLYYVGEGNLLRKLAFNEDKETGEVTVVKTNEKPKITYFDANNGEEIVSSVKVCSPINSLWSEEKSFTAKIKPPRTVTWEEINGKTEFNEYVLDYDDFSDNLDESQAYIKVRLNEANPRQDLWAFLKTDKLTSGQIEEEFVDKRFVIYGGNVSNRTGLKIPRGSTESEEGTILFLDGESKLRNVYNIPFEVVLCTEETYDETKVVKGYDSITSQTLKIFNKDPEIKGVYVNESLKINNSTIDIPMGMSRKLQAYIKDADFDITNEVDETKFECKWTAFWDGEPWELLQENFLGNPHSDENYLEFDFPEEGEWVIELRVRDKDIKKFNKNAWSESVFKLNFKVKDQPTVSVDADALYLENDAEAEIKVKLDYWDSKLKSSDKLKVKLTVKNNSENTHNKAKLILDAEVDSDNEGVYYVYLDRRNYTSYSVRIKEMDGTDESWRNRTCFNIKAEVVSDLSLPSVGKNANEYYLSDEEGVAVKIDNVIPEHTVTIPNTATNRWVVSGGVCTSYPIRYNIIDDILSDFEGRWEEVETNGVRVTFTIPELDKKEVIYFSKSGGGVFEPDFGDNVGPLQVVVTIEDKDGAIDPPYTYYYEVKPSKYLVTASQGPGAGLSTSKLSTYYGLYGKLGAGHTYVGTSDVAFSQGKDFRLRWNCGNRASVEVLAFGYKVNSSIDNGSLDNNRDIPIDTSGDSLKAGLENEKYYDYHSYLRKIESIPATEEIPYYYKLDSYFYCWLLHITDENSKIESSVLGDTFSPEQPGKGASVGKVQLPTKPTDDGNYFDTEVEAIFAKEYLPEDNLGDINGDGIPDVFAHKVWGGGNLIELASGGGEISENNLRDLSKFNGDGDKLPKRYKDGSCNYAPIGPDFTARLEIRGFHEGLNALDYTTSEPSFNDLDDKGQLKRNDKNELVNADELLAWREFKRAQWANIPDDPDNPKEPFNENIMPTTADLAEWSPEPSSKDYPRMDPTVEDTDGDGFPDGWEYYLWYTAHVTARVPNSKVRFERFNFNDIVRGIEISADEVEARFNPCAALSPAIYNVNPDFDDDGLSDLEELAIGTNPCHWDTDGDGMCDGWEVLMNLDPMETGVPLAAIYPNEDGDFMAFLDLTGVPAISNEVDGTITFYPRLVQGVDYKLELSQIPGEGEEVTFEQKVKFVNDVKGTLAVTITPKTHKVKNADGESEDVPVYYGLAGDPDIWGMKLVASLETSTADFKKDSEPDIKFGFDYVLLHDQVRLAVGFDPRTAWSGHKGKIRPPVGYVADRWIDNPAGLSVNTREYRAYDEYLVMKYRREILLEGTSDVADDDRWGVIITMTTNPSVTNPKVEDSDDGEVSPSDKVAEELDKAFTEAGSNKGTLKGHGADTDGNGVPDGWDLYMGRNPSRGHKDGKPVLQGEPEDEDGVGEAGERDYDGDKVPYKLEYAGVDSCNAYKDCPSIYENHPDKTGSGWYNKFFPTNPGGRESYELREEGVDTDADGIDDGKEFSKFCIDFYNAGNWYSKLELTFIYGKPEDDGSTCIRGGGLNPCTIDTDQDGIPDGWEMQHAGVPVNAKTMQTVAPWHLENPAIERILGVKIADGTFVADGIYAKPESGTNTVSNAASGGTNDTSNVVVNTPDNDSSKSKVYIAGGMDPTWAGDANTDYHNEDKLLGTIRDVDFDHDGLQNYQEYLIQAARHLRYDDISTPLMGRLLTESPSGSHRQEFKGYVQFDAGSATNFVEIAKFYYGAATVNSRVNYVKDDATSSFTEPWTDDGWRNLGYFAPPVRYWDASILSGKKYMFPLIKKMAIHSSDSYPVAGYASSDPRMADTDGDGMDDYYEMFHGLNPILGNDADRVDDSEWGYLTAKHGDIISLTYKMGGSGSSSEEDNATIIDISVPAIDISAYRNEWTNPSFHRSSGGGAIIGAVKAFDPVLYPWLQGTAMVDSDGDGMRNEEERILANVADPMPRHTDPTPLWFTERTTPISFVSQYYTITYPAKWSVTAYTDTPGFSMSLHRGSTSDEYMFSFEEGEGYDTDGDFKYDGAEVIKAFSDGTDPLKFDDPDRRQALWLDGVNSFVMSPFLQKRIYNGQDLLKQFTVECWVRPEKQGEAQTIIDRSFWYYGDHVNSDVSAIRANFRIGLSDVGEVYGMFDNNKAQESGAESSKNCQFVWGRKLKANEWAHIALTFDGDALKLYIDGEMASVAHTDLIPANGVFNIVQDPGNLETFPVDTYRAEPGALFIGARPVKAADVAGNAFDIGLSAFRNYREFFGGYVDEVRVWDGARSAIEIKDNYLKRFGFAEATQNRDDILKSWLNGGSRNNNDGMPSLPPELLFHYNFVTLPGAVNPDYVAKTPAGFNSQVVNAVAKNDPYGAKSSSVATDINVAWWAASRLRSTVYNDYRVVPWIKNTVEHLTPIDGAALDSFIYTDQFGYGYTHATKYGLPNYTFNNTAQPYSSYYLHYGFYFGANQAEIIANQHGESYSWVKDYSHFTVRSLFAGSTDLVPLGGAFAKTCPKMWDGAVADAWELTGSDDDADGLADWWEKKQLNSDDISKLSWDSVVDRNGVKMSAGEAYKLDIFGGMQPDNKELDPAYASTIDSDKDFIPDWWERLYGDITKFSNTGDADGDGLTDYVEYFISEKQNYGVKFNPTKPKSANEYELDYFFKKAEDDKLKDKYIGEIFTDHDMIEDSTEAFWGSEFMDRNKWDALADRDDDGWSNFAEARNNDFVSRRFSPSISHYYVDGELNDMPIPVLDLTLRYNGSQSLVTMGSSQKEAVPIQIEVYSDVSAQKKDVKFTLEPGKLIENKTYYVGPVSSGLMRGNLAPGHIKPGSLTLSVKDASIADMVMFATAYRSRNDEFGDYLGWDGVGYCYLGTRSQFNAAVYRYGEDYVWEYSDAGDWQGVGKFEVRSDIYMSKGEMFLGNVKVGDIDYASGEFVIDLSRITSVDMLGLGSGSSGPMLKLDAALVQFGYDYVIPTEQSNKLRVLLGEAQTGHIKEGKNTIVAFYDLDADGKYTPGEPMGTATGVDVGWRKGTAEIELTDVSPIITRANLLSGETDRNKNLGNSSPDIASDYSMLPGDGVTYERVRVVRAMVNNQMLNLIGATNVVVDKVMYLANRDYLHEGDILSEGEFDIDWNGLPSVMPVLREYDELKDPTEIAYAIIFGDEPINFAATNKLYTVMTVRKFDALDKRAKPLVLSPVAGEIIPNSYPTFKWKMENGNDSYTAFKVQILENNAVVWDSGIRRAPALNEKGEYVFVADAYVGDELERGKSYSWRVSMYNAKFQDDLWSISDGYVFKMMDTGAEAGYATIPVSVKYFGPKAIADASEFVVEAFTTPDFTGTPVARAVVTDSNRGNVTEWGTEHKTNVELVGLPAGEYYLRAYADMGDGNRKRDDIESWGYACQRGMQVQNIYRPLTIKVTGENVPVDMVDIYIEDVDIDGNGEPDADIANNSGFDGDDVVVDVDGDGIPDDFDGDGVADWAENFINKRYSEVLGRDLKFSLIDNTSDGVTPDYLVELFDGITVGEIFARDADYDGLPDWWEDYARKNYKPEVDPIENDVKWNTIVTYNGNRISAGLAFVTDAATIKNNKPLLIAYKATGDVDGNDIPDWWEIKYNIAGLAGDVDSDNDGLTNREEFYLSEAYDTGMIFSPVDPKSANGVDLDYLVKIKNSNVYAVEIFYGDDADRDGLPDWWEYHVRTTYFADLATAPEDITWDMTFTYNGKTQTAGDFFKDDIKTNGLLEILEKYKETSDIDGDNLPDWWEKKYGIFASGAEDDNDEDGLTNWEEFLLSEKYKTGYQFSPVESQSVNKPSIDAFVKLGELDAREIVMNDDKDYDSLPSYWEFYALQNYSPTLEAGADGVSSDTVVKRNGVTMTALQAFIEDLKSGELKMILDKSDTDGDYMPYWWEKQYGIFEESGIEDHDGDGLDNWAEYVLSEIFALGVKFDPTVAKSANSLELDYFFKIGELYAGEIFSDHDFIDDVQEDAWGKEYANRYAWDANSDVDEDGWSNFAEARYNDYIKSIVAPNVSHIVGDSEIKDMPIPALKLVLRYNGKQSLSSDDGENGNGDQGEVQASGSLAPIIVQTFTNKKIPAENLLKPDATFTINPGVASANVAYIGTWADKTIVGTLTPGYVSAPSFKLEFAQIARDDSYTFFVGDLSTVDVDASVEWPVGYHTADYETYMELFNKFGPQFIVLQSDEFSWNQFLDAYVITVTEEGSICLLGERIGKIDLKSGDYSLNLGPLQNIMTGGTNVTDAVFNINQSVLRFTYNSVVPALQSNKLELFLGETDKGFVKEGMNTIVAFYDLDGDGKYTPGEPMGSATDVDVGWRQGKAEIELTDVSPIVSRLDLATGISDRLALYGANESHDISNSVGRLMVNANERVRVVRRYALINNVKKPLPVQKVVFDKVLNGAQRAYLSEADFLVDGELDIDWSYLKNEVIDHKNVLDGSLGATDLTHIVYEIFLGDGDIPAPTAEVKHDKVHSTLLIRRYDVKGARPKPVAISSGTEGIEVLRANPIFKWKLPVGNTVHNGYSAFKIEVRKGDVTVWDSGYLAVPARDADGVYAFESDAYIGDKLDNFETYTWRVSMYNAKFRDDFWSDEISFKMNVPEDAYGYASVPVCVKYFGPNTVARAADFVVEAFTTPDFTGKPVARSLVKNAQSVTGYGISHATNAVLNGLVPGRYFIRAYADLKIKGALERCRDSFESWGYACNRGERVPAPFAPTEFTVTDMNGFEKPIDIYIEDVDTNGNSLPDAWEYVKNGGKLNVGTTDLDAVVVKAFGINKVLTENLQNKVNTTTRANAGNSYVFTALNEPAVSALALGFNPEDVTVNANGSIQVESKVESVEIKSVSFDVDGNVVIEIDGKLNTSDGDMNGLGFIKVESETTKTVTCQVLWKSSLSDAEWTVKATEEITVGNGAQTIDIGGLGSEASGFFKVVVTE